MAQVQILVNTVPEVRTGLAAIENVYAGTSRDCDIYDHKPGVVCRQCIVYAGWEDAVSRIEEPDQEEGTDPCDGELCYCPGLQYD